jgi:hypothetical protein
MSSVSLLFYLSLLSYLLKGEIWVDGIFFGNLSGFSLQLFLIFLFKSLPMFLSFDSLFGLFWDGIPLLLFFFCPFGSCNLIIFDLLVECGELRV